MSDLVLSIDQGTTGTTVLILNADLAVVARGYSEFPQIFPKPGWVEHDPEDIWKSVEKTLTQAINAAGIRASDIAAVGITNQRETTVLWDRKTGAPVANAIVWQCRRTADLCRQLKEQGYEDMFQAKTGLLLDPYFSGTKIRWLLDNEE